MRIRSGVLAVLLAAGLLASGSSHAASFGDFGIRAGLGFSNLRGSFADLVGAGTRSGLAAGGFLRLGLVGPVELQPELLYVMKGAKTDIDVTDPGGNVIGTGVLTYQFDYLEIPVLVRFSVPGPGAVRPTLFVGPALGVKVRSRAELDFGSISQSADFDLVKSTDFGIAGGVELRLGRHPIPLLLDARYTRGLVDVMDSQSLVEARTGTFAITAGLAF